jgi:hypothetical protein
MTCVTPSRRAKAMSKDLRLRRQTRVGQQHGAEYCTRSGRRASGFVLVAKGILTARGDCLTAIQPVLASVEAVRFEHRALSR